MRCFVYIWCNKSGDKSDSKVERRLQSNENIQYRRVFSAGVFTKKNKQCDRLYKHIRDSRRFVLLR